MTRYNWKLTALAATLVLAGCSTVKPPEQVTLDLPAQYREAAGLEGAWKAATPADQADRGEWWKIYDDVELNGLITQATEANPGLAIALARVKEARATAGVVDANRGFQLNGGIGPTRLRDSTTSPTTEWRAQVNASYEVDLIGRLSDESRAAKLDAEGQEAAYRSVLLALQADVAQQYFSIRSLDSELAILEKTIALRREEVRLVQVRFDMGDTSELDVAKASTELSIVQAEAESVKRLRAQQDHALAILLGKAPAQFTLAFASLQPSTVVVPAGLPSELLERRPDIAQAQRQLAAASARVGVAKAAFFPKLVLTGSGGYASDELSELFKWSSRSWLLGPLVGTALSLPIFDGGRNKANLARADAGYETQVANYRQQVLVGFQEVENNLSALRTLDRQIGFQDEAIASAKRASHLAEVRYSNGSASYFEVIDAQRTSLAAERAQSQSMGQRSVASVGLIRALGGGWGSRTATEEVATR
ncbi:RND transporter [Methylobacillus sp. MM3]|jgi:multidrug efflux system outer membrane protein|uniref:efflux transporter outer membrane subunit n=1 Tax=Methylobacillus sp. MM3 TaxID=1848039 RepID=UPI0007DF1844|nr:efflux transporter outer membrane subunit [Methylobacillus sp. MM3]OAJ69798.1 RND transporter [Methylobacillus sp. MM3]